MPKAIIVGASSGIGKDLAIELSNRGYELGLTARRVDLLEQLSKQLKTISYVKKIDAAEPAEARKILGELIQKMGGAEIIIYNAGLGESSGRWEREYPMHLVNVVGFAAISNYAFQYFKEKKIEGQIVGISSVGGTRGMRQSIGYSASKAFMSNYMAGQRHKSKAGKMGITITDIRPGFIATDMTQGQKGMFWVQSSKKAAKQIANAIEAKKDVAFITKRWWLVAKLFGALPDFIWNIT